MSDPVKNLLEKESSPYLRLHAEQPVHWMPWGEAAFQKAEKENKPVLLSIGYSTCHWCHVMARESFEDPEIAAYLNEHFISIKLDREERPDIDAIYMAAHMAMHEGSGGWPLNVFLTPERKPFFSGTYFPPKAKAQHPGFDQVIRGVVNAWTEKEAQILEFSSELTSKLNTGLPEEENTENLGKNFLSHTQSLVRSVADQEHFGWGGGPKFPHYSLVRFLLHSEEEKDRDYALQTLRKMAESGLYDQLNGGFHRYCVDREWVVPHFEKMLYDQAQLLEAYLDGFLVSGDSYLKTVSAETCDYILREMVSADGVFYSAQDAQSEGKEGKFSCWTMKELKALFSEAEVSLLSQHFSLSEEGNFYDFSDPEALKKQNVLVLKKPLKDFSPEEVETLEELKKKMFQTREKRVPPATDKKVLLNWNALMISALARASLVLEDESYLKAAERAYEALLTSHHDGDHYYHSSLDNQRHGEDLGADLSSLLYASRTLFHCTLEQQYLSTAVTLAETILKLFYDEENGGFYETTAEADLIMRMKGEFDNALPTVSSQMVRELRVLSSLTENPRFKEASEKTQKYHQASLQTMPTSLGGMLLALAETDRDSTVFLSESPDLDYRPFLRVAHQAFPPPLTLTAHPSLSPFYRTLKESETGITAYFCEGKTCQLPTQEVEVLRKQLKK